MTRVAAVDAGTNSLRLLVADITADQDGVAGTLTDVLRRNEIVRLGQDVDRTGRFAPEALSRTRATLRSYAEDVQRLDVQRVRVCATSATRDAANREEFVGAVVDLLGVQPEVITGDEEAALSFAGATRKLAERAGQTGVPGPPYLVLDIGGGSTEFVLGSDAASAARSVDIGCVRLTERHFAADPPTDDQVAAAVADIERGLAEARRTVDIAAAATLVGVAGTVTTFAGLALDLPEYDAERIHHAKVSADRVHEVTEWLLTTNAEERTSHPVIHPGRVDVIVAGALVLDRVVRQGGFAEVVVSEHDILDGIAWSLV